MVWAPVLQKLATYLEDEFCSLGLSLLVWSALSSCRRGRRSTAWLIVFIYGDGDDNGPRELLAHVFPDARAAVAVLRTLHRAGVTGHRISGLSRDSRGGLHLPGTLGLPFLLPEPQDWLTERCSPGVISHALLQSLRSDGRGQGQRSE